MAWSDFLGHDMASWPGGGAADREESCDATCGRAEGRECDAGWLPALNSCRVMRAALSQVPRRGAAPVSVAFLRKRSRILSDTATETGR